MGSIRRVRLIGFCAASLTAAALAACGGGGGGSAPVPVPVHSATTTGKLTTATVSIVVPKKLASNATKRRAYVSPSTAGLIVTVTDGSGTNSYGYAVATSGSDCTTLSSGELQCSYPVNVTSGSATFSAWIYDASEQASQTSTAAPATASGKLLAQQTGVAATITADQANTVALTLQPVVATVTSANGPQVISVSGTRGSGGTTSASPSPVFDGIDADGNLIMQYSTATNGVYVNPIGLSIADGGKGDTTFTPSSLPNSATDAFSATFNGATAVQPTDATTTPYSAVVTATDSLTSGGYANTSSYPTSTATVTVAPLFAYAATFALNIGGAGPFSTVLYGVAAAKPTGATYAIAPTATTATNSCANFTIVKITTALTGPQVVAYTVSATAASPAGTSCVFALTDGTGTVTNTLPFTATAGVIYHPSANDDTFSFSGNEVVTYARPNQFPTPEPTTTAAYNVSQSVTVTNPVTFNGNANAVDFKTSETDTETTGPSTSPITSTVDTFYAFSNTITNGNFYTLGFTTTDSNNYAITATYPSPGLLTDMLPEASGQSWTNTAAETIAGNGNDGTTSTQTYAANGTYTEQINYPSNGLGATGTPNPGATASIVENLDGSGVYTADRNGNARRGDIVYTFATPNAAANTITITTNSPPLVTASPAATPAVTSTTIPNWIPTGYLGAQLETETDADSGATTIPTSCHVPAAYGTSADKITQTRNRVDTVLGEYEVLTFTYYDIANVGPACTVLHDVLTTYYDYSGQTYPGFWSGTPQQITTTDETLALTAEQLDAVARRTDARTAIARTFQMRSSAMPARLEAAHFAHRLETQRRIHAMIEKRYSNTSGQAGF